MEDIIAKENEESKLVTDSQSNEAVKRKHYTFWIKVAVVIAYNSIDAFYSATSFPIFFGRRLEIFYVKILFALIGEVIFFKLINRWRSGKNFKFAMASVLVLFFSFIAGNSIDIILEHIVFKRLIYKTISAHYFLFIYAFILAFVLIVIFNFYAKKMDSKEQTTNFYIPIVMKLGSLAFLFIFFIGSILVARSVTVEDRNALLIASETMKTQMSIINSDVSKYLNAINSSLQDNIYTVDSRLYGNFNINTVQRDIENSLYIYDTEAAIPFSYMSVSINSNYTTDRLPLSLVLNIDVDGNKVASYYNYNVQNDLRATNYKKLSEFLGMSTFIRYINTKEGLFELSFNKEIKNKDENIGYIQARSSGSHIKNIISQYITEGFGSTYLLYNTSDNIIYESSVESYLGTAVDTVNTTPEWTRLTSLMKDNSGGNIFMANSSIMFPNKQKVLVVGIDIASINSTLFYLVPEESILREFAKRDGIFVAFSVILFVMILFVIIFALMARNVVSPITLATRSAETLKRGGGDLRQRIFTNSNDEIGILIFNFNEFIGGLDTLIKNLKGESYRVRGEVIVMDNVVQESAKRVNDQTASITESVASINNIITSISNVGRSTDQQRHAFSSASIAVEELLQTIFRINENMERQSAAVEETSASIEEMISNITSVAKSVNKADDFSKKLLDDAREGGDTVDEVIEAIHEIEESSDQIKEIINVIQGIAEQTNLLAMNAAIEAAHAGEQGKGFAVVADEIRSLAEHTADNTKSITLIIKDITKRVERTVDLAVYSGKSLDNILDTSGNTARVISEINTANTELEVGGRDILETLKHLNNITYQVKENVKEQMNSGDVVDSQITLLDQITREVSDAIEVNTLGAKDIVDAMRFLNDLAEKTRQGNEGFSDAITRLNDNFKRFNSLIENFVTDDREEREINDQKDIVIEEKSQKDFDIDNLILNQAKLIDNSMSIMDKAAEETTTIEDDDTILKMLQDEFKNSDFFDKK